MYDLLLCADTIKYSKVIYLGIGEMKEKFRKYMPIFFTLPIILLLSGCTVNVGPLSFNIGAPDEDIEAIINEDIPVVQDKEEETAEAADKKAQEENKEDVISLSGKNATLDIDSEGRTTPFVPYRERNLAYSSLNYGDLPYPPLTGEMNDDLNNLISAKVTGILYDTVSPSAIINVLNEDYLVKPGDEIESFQISSITKDYVAIKTGSNVYRAKVGDIVDGELYGSGIYNLGHKFAGRRHPAKNDEVLIVATKRKASQDESKKQGNADFGSLSLPPVPEVIPAGGVKVNLKTQAGEIPLPLGGLGGDSSGTQDTN
ncbi:MAG: hypothetical protein K6A44_07335 [bacterium]|nr:hypothetical protein [bacterium]